MNDVNSSGSFRVKRNPFTQVSNSALRDNNLSLKAKGLYSLIQSFITIPNFILHKSYLMSICQEKEKAFDSAWKELKVNGYLKQYRIPKGKNDSFVYEYDLLDNADLTTPSLINLNKNGEEIMSTKDEISHTPHLAPYANGTTCEPHPMPNGGDINNTDCNNTDSNNIQSNPIQSVLDKEIEKEKTDSIRCDKTSSQSVIDKKGQKNKESFQNATVTSDKHLEKPSAPKYNISEVEEIIKSNIDYDYILMDNPNYKEMLDGVLHVIVSTIVTDFKDGHIGMGNENVPAEAVKSVFLKLTKEEIEYFIENFNRQTNPTIKLTPYIRTALFRNHMTNDFYWKNRVNVDMPQLAERKVQSKTDE